MPFDFRAEKTEVLTEDQQGDEKRVDIVKHVTQNLIKKITALLESPQGTDAEKRLRKVPEMNLGISMVESAAFLGSETLLGKICHLVGECQASLARAEVHCELDVERDVLAHLQYVAEVEIPSISKLRKALNKSTLDMDSAKSRFTQIVRQSHVPGANMAQTANKADLVKEEYEDACNKVQLAKDHLSIEMCDFISKETDHSSFLLSLLEIQALYHKNALKVIENAIPKVIDAIETYPVKPLFGMPLKEHLQATGREISVVLEACILTLLDTAMTEEGLFRLAGSTLKMKKLRSSFDAHILDMEEFSYDPHIVAGILKQYLRELPEPLLTFDLVEMFMATSSMPSDEKRQALKIAVEQLPVSNYNNTRYLVKFLAMLAEKSYVNKMTPTNIGIVVGPNLLWSKEESAPSLLATGTASAVLETLIIHADYIFPEDVDFQLTGLEESFIAAESIYDSHTNPVMPHVVQDVPQTCPNDSHINVDRSDHVKTLPRSKKPAPPPPPRVVDATTVAAPTCIEGLKSDSLPRNTHRHTPVTSHAGLTQVDRRSICDALSHCLQADTHTHSERKSPCRGDSLAVEQQSGSSKQNSDNSSQNDVASLLPRVSMASGHQRSFSFGNISQTTEPSSAAYASVSHHASRGNLSTMPSAAGSCTHSSDSGAYGRPAGVKAGRPTPPPPPPPAPPSPSSAVISHTYL